MEFTKIEVSVIEETVNQLRDNEMGDLTDLQLALVGGGIGEVIVA